jgi:hypothetical protein
VMAPDCVVVGNCPAHSDNGIEGGTLDCLPFLNEPAVMAERMKGKNRAQVHPGRRG